MASRKSGGSNITRLKSGSLRARIRRGGQEVVKTFPLFGKSPSLRAKQKLDAEAWVTATLTNLENGTHVDQSEIKDLTVGDVLRTFREKGLGDSKEKNAKKDRNRIDQILEDDISNVRVLNLRTPRLTAYRDELIERFKAKELGRRERDHTRAIAEGHIPKGTPLPKIPAKRPARSTLLNKIGMITRAVNFARHNIHDSIPRVELPQLPRATPGRDRRVSEDELEAIFRIGGEIDPVIPHAVKFAIATALRKERILEFRERLIVDIGFGYRVIKYPQGVEREKGVGIIPLTRDLRSIIETAKAQLNVTDRDDRLFQIGDARFDNTWQETMVKAGISGLHFHDLRHEATSRLFESGLGMMEVMSITGHSTAEMVKRYSHFSAIKIIEKLDGSGNVATLEAELSRLIGLFLSAGGNEAQLSKMVASTVLELEPAE